MNKTRTTLLLLLFFMLAGNYVNSFAQSYKPAIEWKKFFPADPRLIIKSGYLIVPENREKPQGKKIKMPFIFIRRPGQDPKKNISLYSVGGPGYSTIAGIDSIGYEFGYLKFGGTIMFDQRGTKNSFPSLVSPEIDDAIRQSYRKGLNKDSLVNLAAKTARGRFTKAGIDLSCYNTLECAEDINDLRQALGLDSLNLIGLSYSGGLMLTVARNHPEAVRTLILRSPLPGFVNYEEHALVNFNEALEQVFANCRADSANRAYLNLKERFHKYFSDISGKKFTINYLEKGSRDSIPVTYDKSDLLTVIDDMLSGGDARGAPKAMVDIMAGKHASYIRELLDGYFAGNSAVARGMRYSVFCSEQVQFADGRVKQQQNRILPWLADYRYNNVNPAICSCWKVKSEPVSVKIPVASSVPAIIVGGDSDPGCSLFYNRLIKRTIPNSQLLIRHNEGHGSGFKVDGVDYLELFLAHPYQKLVSRSKDLIIE